MATLMRDQLAMVKEGYEYLIDVFYKALKVAGGIEVHELIDYIKQHAALLIRK